MTSRKNRTKKSSEIHSAQRLLSHPSSLSARSRPAREKHVLISGGAGFIGSNLAHRLLSSGKPVLLYDNLSRPGVEKNFRWLQSEHGSLVRLEIADVRNAEALKQAVRQASGVFHFAAQTAVTTSFIDPIHDFEVNVRGTLNVLEALRALNDPPPLLLTSTNKVYGDLEEVELCVNAKGSRYQPVDESLKRHGLNEAQPLNCHSPYACSKGSACQYALDYARTFQLPTVAFHLSCIYGPHQMATEDQGWVAHFLIQALENGSITIYGDGRQVRDVLFVEDLVDALLLAQENIDSLAGQAFNIGGGPANTISLLELIDLIASLRGRPPEVQFDSWRSADQRYYVSDVRKFSAATGWSPQVGVREGVTRLHNWLCDSRFTSTVFPPLTETTSNVNGRGHPLSGAPRHRARLRISCRNGHGRHVKLAAPSGGLGRKS